MTLPFDAMFPSFEVYSMNEPARRVAADLRGRSVSHALFRIDPAAAGRWELLTVSDELLAALDRRRVFRRNPTVEKALVKLLKKWREKELLKKVAIVDADNVGDLFVFSASFTGPAGAYVLRGENGVIRGVGVGGVLALLAERVTVYPKIASAAGTEVAPDQVVEFSLTIDVRPPRGTSTPLEVAFPDGAETLNVVASVTSDHFAQADDSPWFTTFTLDRRPAVTGGLPLVCCPPVWTFRARAQGDRTRYSLSVQFVAAGHVIGAVAVTLVRSGSGLPPKQDEPPLMLPLRSGPRCAIVVSSDSNQHYTFSCYRDGVLQSKAPAPFDYEQYFNALDAALTREAVDIVTQQLTNDTPVPVVEFIGASQDEGLPLLIASVGRVAPFEIVRTKNSDTASLLGVVRPVLRWVDAAMPGVTSVEIGSLAAIRPAYTAVADRLPQAEAEEAYLREHFGDRVLHFATKADVDRLLNRDDVRLIHFAGHATGAQLTLEDRAIPSAAFDASKRLVLQKPFFFVNGCRTGASADTAPSITSNFARSLLKQGFCGAVAPSIRVKSEAALEAAKLFYAPEETATVVERVQKVRIRGLASDVPDEHRASYLSYLAFASSSLRLTF